MAVRNFNSPTIVGAALGTYVVLAGVATLVGMPWQYSADGAALAVLRIVGTLLAIGVGVGIGWLALERVR